MSRDLHVDLRASVIDTTRLVSVSEQPSSSCQFPRFLFRPACSQLDKRDNASHSILFHFAWTQRKVMCPPRGPQAKGPRSAQGRPRPDPRGRRHALRRRPGPDCAATNASRRCVAKLTQRSLTSAQTQRLVRPA